ncbi:MULTISPECIES: class I SAM-dependent methyltransferase [Nesterenkonia]|uniref:Ubiquinone/menaquinone biosynthesis C-methylase UbiE n=1 Tax=Nesterenkonia xinjiangensis TaxID=225327 RepID=A0A7Z0GKR5_9MICC|nr:MULTISPECIES: class I SAM-dependent methyltransferase [Nesterenkonia]MDZ5076685.1 methyltransferase domain-containing protein [Nesterenkonia sp. HG001]NYJ77229.1 ubiquinone/menaquinone biosynthesis C-methylase UbiE [Nesterenkonia xinjiangensis]
MNVQDTLDDYWSRWAADYEAHQQQRLRDHGEVQAWERVWRPVLPQAPADVLDVGTGTGHAALIIAGLGHRVTGIDLAEGMLAEARRKVHATSGPRFLRGDAADPPVPPGFFDAITARYLLWTLRHPDEALRRWHRLLRPGGVLVAVDALWFPQGLTSHDAHDGDAPRSGRSAHFRRVYGSARQDLPLAEAADISVFAARIEQAGFSEVSVDELPEIMERDRRHGVAPGHEVQRQHRIRAVRR